MDDPLTLAPNWGYYSTPYQGSNPTYAGGNFTFTIKLLGMAWQPTDKFYIWSTVSQKPVYPNNQYKQQFTGWAYIPMPDIFGNTTATITDLFAARRRSGQYVSGRELYYNSPQTGTPDPWFVVIP
jgi:hypothetical protein